jgi:hypothetical protein
MSEAVLIEDAGIPPADLKFHDAKAHTGEAIVIDHGTSNRLYGV